MAHQDERRNTVVDREAELHNSRINNMYSILKNAENEQLEQLWEEAKRSPSASVVTPEKPAEVPAYEHAPATHETVEETWGRAPEQTMPAPTPVAVEATPIIDEQAGVFTFSMTTAAKKAIAIFASVTTIMMTMIGVNTHIINQREAQISALEASNASMRASIARLEEQMEYESSEEVIREWAMRKGLAD